MRLFEKVVQLDAAGGGEDWRSGLSFLYSLITDLPFATVSGAIFFLCSAI